MFLIVTADRDLTTDYLVLRAEARQISVFRFHPEHTFSQYQITIELRDGFNQSTIVNSATNERLNSSAIRGAYFRKPVPPKAFEHSGDPHDAFASGETTEAMRGLWRTIPNDKWLNSPDALWLANNKLRQLSVASQLGFRTPPTIVTTDPAELVRLQRQLGQPLVAKPVRHGMINQNDQQSEVAFTSLIEPEDLDAIAAEQSIVPMIVQPLIRKSLDLRVTVVDRQVFPAAIRSQDRTSTTVDWRIGHMVEQRLLPHERFELPPPIRELCLEINRKMGLRFSCIDLVLSDDGDYYFLEINANGNWAWIEQVLGLKISDAILDVFYENH